jgi:hypothetical protein
MRATLMRIGIAAAIAAGTVLLGATAAAAQRPADDFAVRAGGLVLTKTGAHYQGTMRVSVRNLGSTAVSGGVFTIDVPAGLTVTGLNGAGGCVGTPANLTCDLLDPFEPGQARTVTISFGSFAAGAPYARITEAGRIAATYTGDPAPSARESDDFAAILRGTNGSVWHPRPYQPSTVSDLALTGGSATVTRDETGTYAVRVPLTAQDRTDAFNIGAVVWMTAPAGAGWPRTDPPSPCFSACDVPGGWLASGERREFAVLFTMPAETAPGTYEVTFDGAMNVNGPEPVDATPADNRATVAFTILAA